MGFVTGMAEAIARTVAREGLTGRLLTYGRVQPNYDVTYGFVRSLFRDLGLTPSASIDGPSDDLVPHAEIFFEALGFEIESLDVSDYESATHVWDLNRADVPEELVGRYDVALNNGTLEHIFHVPNCLANVTRMLKTGGYAMHWAPCHNAFDHGFYTFSPLFFFDYYSKNKFRLVDSMILRRDNGLAQFRPWGMVPFNPYHLSNPSMFDGKMDTGIYIDYFVAQKTEKSTETGIPQQGDYREAGNKPVALDDPSPAVVAERRASVERKLMAENAALKSLIERQNQVLAEKDQVQTELYRQILSLQGIDPNAKS